MSNYEEKIPIFFTVDDAYVPFLAVALQSLIDNSSEENFYLIKILYTNIREENKKKIKKYEKENVNIEFVDLNYYIEKVKDKLYTRDYYSKTTYFRLFLPELYPQFDKVLYLDSDIVILADVADLFHTDMGDNLVAAAPDDIIQNNKVFQDYVEKVVGVAKYQNYFNAGILLMNLDALRKFDFQKKFLYLLETVKFSVAQDQDYLNRLCKGRVKLISTAWDRMPMPSTTVKDEDIKILHFNFACKPWHFEDVLYSEYFWKYAEETEYINEIRAEKENYTEEQRYRDRKSEENLRALAQKENDCVGDDRRFRDAKHQINNENVVKAKDRLKVLEKIKELEREGRFDVDAEDDPETIELMPEKVDYLREKRYSKLKSRVAYKLAERYVDELLKENKLIIKDVRGIENLQAVKSGAMITCNHFNPFDCFSIETAFRLSGQAEDKKLYKIIREGNYTNFPGLYGFLFRNCNTLPLSSNKETMVEFMKAVDTILQRGDFILIYPEQSLWWNYRKPKPLKDGAYKLSVRSNVPVIPVFITMQDSDIIGEDGFPIQEYIINIEKPIYPQENLTRKENTQFMKNKNFEVWKEIYEKFYNVELEYTTDTKEEINI